MRIIFFLPNSFISFLISLTLYSGCYVNTKQTTVEDDLYKILNVFLKKYNKNVFLNREINCCGFLRSGHPKDNIYYYLEENSYIINDNVNLFKSIIENNITNYDKKINVDFNKITNKFVKPHSSEFYNKMRFSASLMRDKKIKKIERSFEFPDLNISIFFSKDRKYSILNCKIIYSNENIEEKIIILKKQRKNWIELKSFLLKHP